MKILIVGGNGTIGRYVSERFRENHEVVVAGRNSGDVTVDIGDVQSIKSMFETVGAVDAIVNIAGDAKWMPFDEMSEADFYVGIKSKLMGQVHLVQLGTKFLKPGGSITLTTGILADEPELMTTSPAMVNGAIHSFVRAVALELPADQRINVVSAGLVEASYEKYKTYFPGANPVPMPRVVNAYVRSVEGKLNGMVIHVPF